VKILLIRSGHGSLQFLMSYDSNFEGRAQESPLCWLDPGQIKKAERMLPDRRVLWIGDSSGILRPAAGHF